MRIAFITPEAQPFSKTGGLGDVAGALPWALARLGAEVLLISPYYAGVARAARELGIELHQRRIRRTLEYGGRAQALAWRSGEHAGVRVAFCEHGGYFQRENLYVGPDGKDYPDNAERFTWFQRSALEYLLDSNWRPDVVHCHDWQAGAIPLVLKSLDASSDLAGTQTVFTIHNLGYQGIFPPQWLADSGVGRQHFDIEGLEYYGQVSWLKAGIVFADAVTTVSPSYAQEILTPEQGMGLDGVLRAQQAKLSGILNGIDSSDWDPASDASLPAGYDAKALAGKWQCKTALQAELGLRPSRKALLIGMIARFDRQKGVNLALQALPKLLGKRVQFALLGSGDPELQEAAVRLALEHPGRAAARIGFDPGLARRIYAGCDALLMPSLYEPCGLNQMYAQRYGTVPVVHETGGLRDTVRDAGRRALAKGKATGFTFKEFDAEALSKALRRALKLYSKDSKTWRKLLRACMKLDNSWEHSARQYMKLFASLAGTGLHEAESGGQENADPPARGFPVEADGE